MIKSIFYEQDKEYLRERFEDAILKENLDFFLKYLVDDIQVGELHEFYVMKGDLIIDHLNLLIDEIEPIYEDYEDYLIHGRDEHDKEVEVKLSETEFWTR